MRLQRLIGLVLLLLLVQSSVVANSTKANLLSEIRNAGIHPDDSALIEANLDQLSVQQLTAIREFMPDSGVVAGRSWFSISAYTSWDDYNFNRPVGDQLLAILARRDLFLDPARQLNHRALTNMSPQALAALAFSQVYVEEKWDHEVPWDGDPNDVFNWVHPDLLHPPNILRFMLDDYLYQLRVEYWWATYWSLPLGLLDFYKGTDLDAALRDTQPPNANVPRLAGNSYPLGNQLYLQTAETVYWYADYLRYGAERYGAFDSTKLDTRIHFPTGSVEVFQSQPPYAHSLAGVLSVELNPESVNYPELLALFNAPFAADLRLELHHPETAAFWNVMRFVHAGARQREGGSSPEHPENGQPLLMALRYDERTPQPVGRQTSEISAFALLTTVYSDSLLLDFTNWNFNTAQLILVPSDESRSDGLHRQVSERNKAIQVMEQMGSEASYPNATHIAGSRGLGLNLTTQYDDPLAGDFLPYTAAESQALVSALVVEARDYGLEASRISLCHSPLLKRGYEAYVSQAQLENQNLPDWIALVGDLCN
jgi:hypothetical protein